MALLAFFGLFETTLFGAAAVSVPVLIHLLNRRRYRVVTWAAMRFLLRGKSRHDVSGLSRTIAVADPILVGLGFGPGRIATIETDDPDDLLDALKAVPRSAPAPRTAAT